MKLEVTVIIPTHNPRREYLARTLEALKRQTLEADKWELIIVDNASPEMGDHGLGLRLGLSGVTKNDGSEFGFPNARVVREEKLGLTYARVRGFREAKGEIVVLVDDDNELKPDYLEKAVEILGKNPLLGAIGGKALPEYETEPPEWLKGIRSGLGLRDLGSSIILNPDVKEQGQVEGERWKAEKGIGDCGLAPEHPPLAFSKVASGLAENSLTRKELGIGGTKDNKGSINRVRRRMTEFPDCAPIGAGMVIRREAAMEYVDDLKKRSGVVTDRQGKSLSSGGDNDICLTVLEHGWQVGYFPELELTHLIPKERMTVEYQCRMARDAMRSFIVMLDQHGIRPWPAMARWTLPGRVVRSWWRTKPWKGIRERLSFENAMGQFLGRSDIGGNP